MQVILNYKTYHHFLIYL